MTFQRTIREIKPTMAGMTGPRRKSEARNREQLPSFSDGPTLTRGTSGSTLRCTPVTWGSAPTGAFCPWTLSTPLTKPDSRVWQGSVYRSCHELISILLAFHYHKDHYTITVVCGVIDLFSRQINDFVYKKANKETELVTRLGYHSPKT